MACLIPNFNFAFTVIYDITNNTPTVQITNQSTGANLANIDYWFELITPSGVTYHAGTALTPDESGIWAVIDISENIPQSNGSVEFDNSIPYKVIGYAKDNANNMCQVEKQDIICAPTGNKGTNFGLINMNVNLKCSEAKLKIVDTTNYLYKGVTGNLVSNQTTFVYPANEDGVAPPNYVVNNKTAFLMPIPVNGKGHQLFRNSIYTYTLSSGNQVKLKYKYKNDDIDINCNMDLCSIMCGLKKYRESLTDENGQCSVINQAKINELVLDIAQLMLALDQPNCGFDIETLHAKIKSVLVKNDCLCNDNCGGSGNNTTTELKCDDIDIACVWNSISDLLLVDQDAKDKFCTLVSDCIEAMDADECAMPFISGVTFTATAIVGNFILANQTNSNSLKVYYKLNSSGTWILASTLDSNATTHTILGTFTEGELYDFKVVNNCTRSDVDSSIVSGVIPETQDLCYFFDLMYSGLPDGIYGVQVDSSQVADCDKQKPVLLDSAFISGLMPCSIPVNVKINESSLLTWNAEPGDYEVSYKLKVAGSWTVHSTTTFAGTAQFKDLSALSLSPLSDYEFRVIHKCTSGDSLPIYTDIDAQALAQCPSTGDFIAFNETSGELTWTGNGNTAGTFVFSAFSGGSMLGSPIGITFSAGGTIIIADYSNITGLLGVGDEVIFSVYQDCGGGSTSDIQSHNYLMVGTTASCPDFAPGYGFNQVENDIIKINVSAANTPDSTIMLTQWELKVNNRQAGTGFIVIDGAYETRIKSNVPIKQGDMLTMRFRSYGDTQANNITALSPWSAWLIPQAAVTTNEWDDTWKAIPLGWVSGYGCSIGGSGAFYKITKDGKMEFRGSIETDIDYDTGYATYTKNFLQVDAGIYSSLSGTTNSAGNADSFPLSVDNNIGAGVEARGRFITRAGAVFTAVFATNNTGTGLGNLVIIPLGGLKIG